MRSETQLSAVPWVITIVIGLTFMSDEIEEKAGANAGLKNIHSKAGLIDMDKPMSEKDSNLNTATTANQNTEQAQPMLASDHDYLYVKQIQAEHRAVDNGGKRYWDRVVKAEKSAPAHMSGASKLQDGSLRATIDAISAAIAKYSKNSRKPSWYPLVADVEPKALGWIAVSTMVESFVANWDRQRYMKHCGLRVQVEYNFVRIKGGLIEQYGSDLGKKRYKAWEQETKLAHKNNHLIEMSLIAKGEHRANIREVKWNDSQLMDVGVFLWQAVTLHSGIFQERKEDAWCRKRRSIQTTIRPALTPEGEAMFSNYRDMCQRLQPSIEPMRIQPNAWSPSSKPFLTDDLNAVTNLISNGEQEQLDMLFSRYNTGEAKIFFDALNHTCQATQFAVDRYMLDFVSKCIDLVRDNDSGIKINGLPNLIKPKIRKKPEHFNTLSKDERELIFDQINLAEEEVMSVERNIVQWGVDYSMASEMALYDAFWLAWKVDQRSRYVCTTMFNPQRGDHIRALFSFARKRPLTEEGLKHLKRHIANMYAEGTLWGGKAKLDKVSNAMREQWVDDEYEELIDIAKDPMSRIADWKDAGEPMQFIKALQTLLLVHEHGVDVETDIAIFCDAASSGTQHFSAICKSSIDGILCNLVPNDEPSNIYQVGADRASVPVNDDLAGADAERANHASMWVAVGAPNVLTSKRNYMTAGYDSKPSGMADQLYEDVIKPYALRKLRLEIDSHPFPDSKRGQRKAARYLADINYEQIPSVLPSSMQGLAFLKAILEPVARLNRPQYWSIRSGFPAVNQYFKMYEEEIHFTRLNIKTGVKAQKRKRSTVSYAVLDKTKIDLRESKRSIGANFIHSRDADHAHHILYACKHRGIDDVIHIHDCFGTHPSQMDDLHHIIRETFIQMYDSGWCAFEGFMSDMHNEYCEMEVDPFAEVHGEIHAERAIKAREIFDDLWAEYSIPKGTLNLQNIRKSLYFFH